jgi:hypothetical protein
MTWMEADCWVTTTHTVCRACKSMTIGIVFGTPGNWWHEFLGADELLCDFFAAVEQACAEEGSAFEFETDEIELETEDDNDAQVDD